MHSWHIRRIFTSDLSRLDAFGAQGVSLKYSWRSWSGVRHADGMVVFAILEGDVQADDGGSRCLLWSSEAAARFGQQASEERLGHCRLALRHGGAEGIFVRSDSRVNECQTVDLQVDRVSEQYWASWGHAVCSQRFGDFRYGGLMAFQRCA